MCKKRNICLNAPVTITPREAGLGCIACGCAAAACLMAGVIVGMLISPRKNVSIASHNGNREDHHIGSETPEGPVSEEQEDGSCGQS